MDDHVGNRSVQKSIRDALNSCMCPAAALADRGEHVAVAHVAEILDASLRGLPPPVAAPR